MNLTDWMASHLTIPKNFPKLLENYRIGYIAKSPEHMAFFGSPYIGLHNLWFTTAYENTLLAILKADRGAIIDDLKHTDSEGRSVMVPSIYPERKVSGEWFNILLLYLTHLLIKVPHPTKPHMTAALIPMQLYTYRTLSAVHSNSFRYLGSEAVAKAVYSQLSAKFILKQLKSWDKYLDYRATATLNYADEHKSIPIRPGLTGDEDAILLLIMTSNAIRSTFKIMYQAYLDVKESGDTESSTGMVTEGGEEGGTIIKEITGGAAVTNAIMHKFADGSILDTAVTRQAIILVPRTAYGDVYASIRYLTNNYLKHKKQVDALIEHISTYIVERMHIQNMHNIKKAELLNKLVDALASSKTDSPSLNSLRTTGDTLILQAMPHRAASYQLRLRQAVVIYITITWVMLA